MHFFQGWPQTVKSKYPLVANIAQIGHGTCKWRFSDKSLALSVGSRSDQPGYGGSPIKSPLNKDMNSDELDEHCPAVCRASSVHPLTMSSQQIWAFNRWTECSSEWLVFAQLLVSAAFSPSPALDW